MKNFLLFIKRNKVLAAGTRGTNSPAMAMSLNAELMQLGFTFTADALEALMNSAETYIGELYFDIIPELKKRMGATRTFKPFWKNFPQDVMNMSDFKLWAAATTHYWSLGHWEPKDIDAASRGYAFEHTVFTPVSLGTEDDVKGIFTNLMSAKGSITPEDKKIVEFFFVNYHDLVFPEVIPFKENLCMAAVLSRQVSYKGTFPVKTATDVLRIATYMSGGDISLPALPKIPKKVKGWRMQHWITTAKTARAAFKFRKFKRSERRFLLGLLNQCGNAQEDMWRHRGRWTRLGEVLHPGEYEYQYPAAVKYFNTIRNDKVETFNGKVEAARKSKNLAQQLQLLSSRAGEFGRRLDDLLRDNKTSSDKVLNAFSTVAENMSNNVLLQLHGHFNNRLNAGTIDQRTVFIKGARARKFVIEKTLPNIPSDTLIAAKNVIEGSLMNKFAKLEPLGKVWIAPILYKSPVPFAMRSSNAALKTLVRGTRLPFGDYKVIRAFVHWFDEHGNRDLDLSANLLDSNCNSVDHVSFTNLRFGQRHTATVIHSGDVRHRQGACAEYIDVDVNATRNMGVRYVIVDVRNFERGPLAEVPECVSGWMGRDFPESDLHFIPKTVQNSFQLTNEGQVCYTVALDLETREAIWLDVDSNGIVLNTSSNDARSIASLLNLTDTRLTTGQLLEMHAKARGTLVPTKEEAEVVFGEDLLHKYDELLAKYL